MELEKAERLAKALMYRYISPETKKDWKFKWDNAVSRFGSCRYSGTITLSRVLTSLNNEDHVRDTILHEIAHAINYERHGRKIFGKPHGKEWKEIAVEVGCDPTRCYDDTVVSPTSKYTVMCPKCGVLGTANRKSSNMNACGICCKNHNNNKWHYDYVLEYIVNDKKTTENLVD